MKPEQIPLAIAAMMAKQIPLSELPRHRWRICWTLDTHLTSETHGDGRGGSHCDDVIALTKDEATESFLQEGKGRKPFILVVTDLGEVRDQ